MKKYYIVLDFEKIEQAQRRVCFHYTGMAVFTNKRKAKKWVFDEWRFNKPTARPEIITVTRSRPPSTEAPQGRARGGGENK